MTLLHMLGARAAPMLQARRGHDSVRGLFARRCFRKGDLLLSVPSRNCYFPHASRVPRTLRRWNRSTLFPEATMWLWRLSPDFPQDRVSLTASVSTDENEVVTLTLSPVEASLAVSIALRYFWQSVIKLKTRVGVGNPSLGPVKDRKADLYVSSLPLTEYFSYGLEAPYFSEGGCGSNVHSTIEQIAWNLRDCILLHAPQEEYRFYDAHPSELDSAILTSIYVVRARVLKLKVIRTDDVRTDTVTSAIVPIVDMLNHSASSPACAACVSLPTATVVVRAARDINVGEELTLDYGEHKGKRMFPRSHRNSFTNANELTDEEEDEDYMCESRYLFSREVAGGEHDHFE
ncbi:hypothetical protein, conserved [Trypanosoma brucei gambiense DAL972]|uniref:SET domain-containing protein n=1 Tax=Trypanosoma brucei gambiense (strain MHOM/CI/86/DAL972) TaxID=679716 RepID=C9ZR29_TRYB9|nr:hypothetical protein, conserved [Trypanosoma brucei gambiense DAL972]CBH11859.1 hypothetical protein, conserved [Trypanosoma brucei gambiense DAL972]|eukprot:XP_011774144.1 hypothetical protein, conserved [Trypanosoma brucei gambiense DAL972]